MSAEVIKTKIDSRKRTTLQKLFNEPCAVEIKRSLMHQAFELPKAGVQSTLSAARTSGLKMVYHPGYGLICELKGEYFLTPSANVIIGIE